MFCKQCGKSIGSDARFCSYCGARQAEGYYSTSPFANAGFATPMAVGPLVRPRAGRMIGGVCAAFAQQYNWELPVVRIITAVAGIVLIPFVVIAYFVAWVAIPEEQLALMVPQQPGA